MATIGQPRQSVASIDDRVGFVLQMQERLYSARANFNTLWQSVGERVNPNYTNFTQTWAEGQRRTNKIFESTATLANNHFSAAVESMLCPHSTRWHSLRPLDPTLWNDVAILQWLDQCCDILFRSRYAPNANFQSQIHESISQIGSFGTGPFFVDDAVGQGLRYRCYDLAECFGLENANGIIDHVQRDYTLTASAALDAEKRGIFDEDSLPPIIREAALKTPTQKFGFIHAIFPNKDHDPLDKLSKAFTSLQVNKDSQTLLKESGYTTQPLLMPRYRVIAKETYGRGPGVDALPDILMLQEMEKSYIRQAQRAAEPPLLLADDGSLGSFDLRGNALNYGTLDANGRPMVVPLQDGSNFQITQEMLERKGKVVESHFLVDIFSILEQPNTQMTATEVLQRAQEKGQLLAPIIGRVQTELFGPMITREMDILHRAGQFPPPPEKIKKMGRFEYEIVYESAIQVAQRKTKALAISATLQQIEPMINADPTVIKVFNFQRTAKLVADANGAPAGMLNTDAEMKAQQDADMQQQQITNLAQLAGPGSQAIKNIADAQRAAGSTVPGNNPA